MTPVSFHGIGGLLRRQPAVRSTCPPRNLHSTATSLIEVAAKHPVRFVRSAPGLRHALRITPDATRVPCGAPRVRRAPRSQPYVLRQGAEPRATHLDRSGAVG